MKETKALNSIEDIIADIRNGKMVILIDDEDRENEGDIILAADFVTPDTINFMATEARGLICLSLEAEQVNRLGIPMMVGEQMNQSPNNTAFTVSIEAAEGVSTGISAADRAHTIRVAASAKSGPKDIIMPGHIFPIRAQKGGVLKRAGHTEASVDLSKLAGLNSAAVICEIMKEDGTMARLEDLIEFSKKHDIKIGTIEDLIRYRLENQTLVKEVATAPFNSDYAQGLQVRVFENSLDHSQSLVIQKGTIDPEKTTTVRVHVENILGDAFKGERYKPSTTLEEAMKEIAKVEQGVLLYLRKEGESSLFANLVETKKADKKAVKKMDPRDYGIGAQILSQLGVEKINLLASNPMQKVVGLKGFGLEIESVVAIGDTPDQGESEEWGSGFVRH